MTSVGAVRREIEEHGILLVNDPVLPSVTRLVAGEPVRGSWWGHPKGHEIFAVLEALEDDPDLLLVKLVSKKNTFVHRALWPELFAVAASGEEWQTRKLARAAAALRKDVEAAGTVRLSREQANAGRELEERLLVHGSQIHTETGAHAKILTSWKRLAKERNVSFARIQPEDARAEIEKHTRGKLPWRDARG
jgi:hypothetical protein